MNTGVMMASLGTAQSPDATLRSLRRMVAGIDAAEALSSPDDALGLGLPALDRALGGGLARAALHEFAPAAGNHLGAASGFMLALAARAALAAVHDKAVLWIQPDFAAIEGGGPYGPGLDRFGLAAERLVLLRVPRAIDVLWAMEEALRCRAVAAVLAELTDDGVADLTATRRLTLAARDGGGLGFLLHHRPSLHSSAAMTRCEIAAAPGTRDRFGGLGRTSFTLSLLKNRRGPLGRWTITWDHHERAFASAALSLGVAATARDRSDRARLVHAG
jgi:protein ImuA